jgi:hypothetical protein
MPNLRDNAKFMQEKRGKGTQPVDRQPENISQSARIFERARNSDPGVLKASWKQSFQYMPRTTGQPTIPGDAILMAMLDKWHHNLNDTTTWPLWEPKTALAKLMTTYQQAIQFANVNSVTEEFERKSNTGNVITFNGRPAQWPMWGYTEDSAMNTQVQHEASESTQMKVHLPYMRECEQLQAEVTFATIGDMGNAPMYAATRMFVLLHAIKFKLTRPPFDVAFFHDYDAGVDRELNIPVTTRPTSHAITQKVYRGWTSTKQYILSPLAGVVSTQSSGPGNCNTIGNINECVLSVLNAVSTDNEGYLGRIGVPAHERDAMRDRARNHAVNWGMWIGFNNFSFHAITLGLKCNFPDSSSWAKAQATLFEHEEAVHCVQILALILVDAANVASTHSKLVAATLQLVMDTRAKRESVVPHIQIISARESASYIAAHAYCPVWEYLHGAIESTKPEVIEAYTRFGYRMLEYALELAAYVTRGGKFQDMKYWTADEVKSFMLECLVTVRDKTITNNRYVKALDTIRIGSCFGQEGDIERLSLFDLISLIGNKQGYMDPCMDSETSAKAVAHLDSVVALSVMQILLRLANVGKLEMAVALVNQKSGEAVRQSVRLCGKVSLLMPKEMLWKQLTTGAKDVAMFLVLYEWATIGRNAQDAKMEYLERFVDLLHGRTGERPYLQVSRYFNPNTFMWTGRWGDTEFKAPTDANIKTELNDLRGKYDTIHRIFQVACQEPPGADDATPKGVTPTKGKAEAPDVVMRNAWESPAPVRTDPVVPPTVQSTAQKSWAGMVKDTVASPLQARRQPKRTFDAIGGGADVRDKKGKGKDKGKDKGKEKGKDKGKGKGKKK